MITELDRLIAVMRNNYLAKFFPRIWYAQEESKLEREQRKDNERKSE